MLPVLVAAVVYFIIGGIWYGPLFGKAWMAASGKRKEDMDMSGAWRGYVISFVAAVVMAWVLARVVDWAQAGSPGAGAAVGFYMWLGFVGTIILTNYVFENRPMNLFAINTGYNLVGLIVMGAILAAWS
jgi:hypothetical protein